jgi:hypothetical protein
LIGKAIQVIGKHSKLLIVIVIILWSATEPAVYAQGYNNNNQWYRSSNGDEVYSPSQQYQSQDGQETAECNDGTVSYSHHHRGTCSHHGGVEEWEDGSQ